MGIVKITHEYVVDIEDKEMVDNAATSLYEDLMNAVKYNELGSWINVEEKPDADPNDIPEFLQRKICTRCQEKLSIEDFTDDDMVCDICKTIDDDVCDPISKR